MKIKKGDILYSEVNNDVCVSIENKNLVGDKIHNEGLVSTDYLDASSRDRGLRKKFRWRKIGSGYIYQIISGQGITEYEVIGNYFKLKNKRKLIKGLASEDIGIRDFFIEIIKAKK